MNNKNLNSSLASNIFGSISEGSINREKWHVKIITRIAMVVCVSAFFGSAIYLIVSAGI